MNAAGNPARSVLLHGYGVMGTGVAKTFAAAGKGLYDWQGLDAQEVRRTAARELGKLLALLERETFAAMKRLQPKTRSHRKESA